MQGEQHANADDVVPGSEMDPHRGGVAFTLDVLFLEKNSKA